MDDVRTIKCVELHKLLSESKVNLIDVREPSEYDNEHIEGSKLLPLSVFDIDEIEKDERMVVFMCHSGIRSANVCRLLSGSSILHGYNLDGGIVAWKQAGFPIKTKVHN